MRTKKRLTGILFGIAMVLGLIIGISVTAQAAATPSKLWIGNSAEIKSSGVVTDTGGTGTVSVAVDGDEIVITMNNFSYTGEGYSYNNWKSAIYYNGSYDLRIVLIGSNTITSPSAGEDKNSYGLYGGLDFMGTITFSGNGSLNISGGQAGFNSCGIYNYKGKIRINDCTINATGGKTTTYASHGINNNGDIIINNATVKAESASQPNDQYQNYAGINIGEGKTIIQSGTLTVFGAKKAFYYYYSNLGIEGILKSLKAGDSQATAADTSVEDVKNQKYVHVEVDPHTHSFTYSANGNIITATCSVEDCFLPPSTEGGSDHVATLTIAAPLHEIYNDKKAPEAVITDDNGIRGSAKVQYYTKNGGTYGAPTETAPTDAGDYKASITLDEATAEVEYSIASEGYQIWVGGKQVSNLNASDVLKDGKVSYDATNNILTLKGANITTGYTYNYNKYGIYSEVDKVLEIKLAEGTSNKIDLSAEDSSYGICNAIEKQLSITGAGSLTVKAEYGIDASKGGLLINECGMLDVAGKYPRDSAIKGIVKNYIAGTGWESDRSSPESIQTNTDNGQNLEYMRVRFPVLDDYPLWIGDTQVNSGNAKDVLGDGTVSFTPATTGTNPTPAILALNGATITQGYQRYPYTYGIYYKGTDSLKVELTGSTNVSGVEHGLYSEENVDLIISGEGSFTADVSEYGIMFNGNIRINSGTVNVMTSNRTGIFGFNGVTISGGTVTATSTKDKGIEGYYGVEISGGIVTATSTNGKGISCSSSGNIKVKDGKVVVTGGSQAIDGKVLNDIAGIGWTDITGTSGRADIAVNTTGQTLNDYKKVQFPSEHTHTIGEGESAQTITFTAWDKENSLPNTAGNYYLTKDVTLMSDSWTVPAGTTNLCLNGHGINVMNNKQAILVDNGNTLNLFGEKEEGKADYEAGRISNQGDMSNGYISENGAIYVKGNSTFNMYGCSIRENKAENGSVCVEDSTFNMYGGEIAANKTENYGAVYLKGSSTFNMHGGRVWMNYLNGYGGVYVSSSSRLNLSGNPRIENNSTGTESNSKQSNVYLAKFTTPTVSVIGKLKNDGESWDNASIGITMEKPGVFTTGSTDELKASAYYNCFHSDDQTCQVITDGNELKIKSPHTHDFVYTASGATITATCQNQGCTLKDSKVVLTLVKPTRTTYGGTGSEKASLNGLNDFNNATEKSIKDTDIKYYKAKKSGDTYEKDGDALSFVPTNVGDYLAEISVAVSKGEVGTIYIASVGYSIAPAVIDSVEVTGIDAPTANVALNTTATTSTANVTLSTVTWAPETSPAAYATKYKATVLATADANYIFTDAPTAKVNGNEATVTKNQDGSLSISYEFAKTALNPVTITATDKEVNYSADGISIPVEGMFTITPGAGKAKYSVTNGTGYGTFDVETGKLTVTKCGTFNISVSTAETDTYAAGAAKTATLTVNKIAPAVTAPIGKNLTYNGQQQELVTAGGSDDGEMQYALGTNAKTAPSEGWDTSVPKKTESDTYYVWYKVVGDENHNDTVPNYVEAKISPVDKTALNSAISDAKAFYNSISKGEIYKEVASKLDTAISEAQKVADDVNADETKVNNAKTAINKAKTDAEKEKKDIDAAKVVIDMINALPNEEVKVSHTQAIAAAREAYDALTEAQKALVKNSDKLKACETALTESFAEDINVISEIKGENKESIRGLLGSYDELTDSEKAAVDKKIGRTGTKKLSDLEEALDITDKIDAIDVDKISLNDEKAISFTRTAYELLSDSQKGMISEETLAKLTVAENKIEELKGQGTLEAVKESAKERLDDYSEAKALADFSEAEKDAYDKAVADGKKAIEDAEDQAKVAEALTNAKAAVDKALKDITDAREAAAEEAAAQAAADQAIRDAKASADVAKEEAEKAAADKYASAEDKTAMNIAKETLDAKIKAAEDLSADATAQQKNDAAKAIEDAVNALNEAVDAANINSAAEKSEAEAEANAEAQLAAAKASAIERLTDYSEAKALADAMDLEQEAYNKAVEAGKDAINAASEKEEVDSALTNAKKAVDEALAKIKSDRADAAAAAAEMEAADQAIADAKTAAETAKKAADEAETNEYASYTDKTEINNAKETLGAKIKAAEDLPADATAQRKNDAAKEIEDAVKALNKAVDAANINSAAAKSEAEAEADAEAQLEAAKDSALERFRDYSEAKAKTDATTEEKTAYEQAVADGIRIIEAVENKEDVAAALAEAKVKVNDALAMIESVRAEAAAKAAAQAEADKAITDAKTTAEEVMAAADAAAGDKYASDTDKDKIGEAETKLNNAIQAAAELGKDATVADKEKAAADIKTATEELDKVTDEAITNSEYAKAAATEAAQLMAAKTSANERLDDYSETKALSDATREEKTAYDKAVADGRKAIEDAADKDAVAQALKDAKAAVDAALAEIEEERAKAAEEAAAQAAADKAVTDAKEAATEAAAAADRAAADEYASEDYKKAISDAKATLKKAVGDADKLPATATTEQKNAAAKAIEDAVNELNATTDKANVDSAAARAAAGEAATEAEKLAAAKEAAIGRLEDYSELKALADATEDEKKYYDGVVAAEKEKINAAADQSAVTTALTAAKEAVNAAIEKIKKDRGDASSAEAVTAAINALPAKDKITEGDRAAIEAARAAYEALSADQKAIVTADTLKKLKDAEDQLVILKAMGEVSAKTGSDVICTGEPLILMNGPSTVLPEGYSMQYALGTDAAAEPAAAAYSTSIPTGTEAGTYYVWYKVRGEGDRGDSKARVVSVSLIKDDSEVLEEDIPEGGIPEGIWIAGVKDLEYTGKALTQEFRLYDGKKRLIEKKDYTVSYKNNTKVYTVKDPKKLTAEDEKNAPSIIIKMKGNYGDVEPAYFNINAIDISTDGFSVSDISTAYNGLKQTPAPVLTWNGKKLKAGTDFTVKEYIEKKDDGNAFKGQADKTTVYDLTVIGIGNFTGSRDIKLTIAGKTEKTEGKEVPVVLMKDVKTPLIPEQKYTGEEYTIDALKKKDGTKIAFTVLYKSRALTEGKDYEAEFTDARDAGTATLILRGLCSTDSDTGFCFAGEKRITFKIAGLQVSKASVGGIAKSYAYTGNEITPAVTLTIDGKAVPAEDYSVTYEKNVKVGTATAVITGHNSCQGTKKVSFKIAPYDMSTDRGAIVINDGEAIETEYVKGGAQPEVSVTFNGNKLFEGSDYTVKFSNNNKAAGAKAVDAPAITITGKGSFKGSKGVNFTIRQREFTEGNGLTLLAPDVNEGSKIGSAKIKILDSNGKELKAGTDYEKDIKYFNAETGAALDKNTKATAGMKIRAEVRGMGTYTSDILSSEMRVIDKTRNISKAKIKIAAQKYTGREVKITDKNQFTTATIKIDGQERNLILGEDFEIVEGSYINNMNKGTAKVTIHGLEGGRYALGGYKTVTFKIGTRSISEWWKGIFAE